MQVFWAVIQDLFHFVIGHSESSSNLVTSVASKSNILPIALTTSASTTLTIKSPYPTARWTTPAILLPEPVSASVAYTHEPKPRAVFSVLNEPTVMYIMEPNGAHCLVEPAETLDMATQIFAYGTALTVSSFKGRYVRVCRDKQEGWVCKEILTPNKREVWPFLTTDTIYTASHPDTKKIRLLIKDDFLAGYLDLVLQNGEYITYRLLVDNRQIHWPNERPRLPGTWQRLLRGVPSVHMSITPKTDSIMEWVADNGEGYLAYVESVAPNKTLMLAAIGLTEPGIFVMPVMTETVWRELRPIFIEIV